MALVELMRRETSPCASLWSLGVLETCFDYMWGEDIEWSGLCRHPLRRELTRELSRSARHAEVKAAELFDRDAVLVYNRLRPDGSHDPRVLRQVCDRIVCSPRLHWRWGKNIHRWRDLETGHAQATKPDCVPDAVSSSCSGLVARSLTLSS